MVDASRPATIGNLLTPPHYPERGGLPHDPHEPQQEDTNMAKAKAPLGKFEGKDVLTAGLEIRNAAGGLNEAMKVSPEAWHHEEEIMVVLRCTVTKVRFDPVKDLDGMRRVHVLTASDATVIDATVVAEALDDQARKIEEAKGIMQLPIKLQEAHDAGEHDDEAVAGCPSCDPDNVT